MTRANNDLKTVLIVEDSPTQAKRLELILGRNGLNTVWARDGEEGLRFAQMYIPTIILLDIELPGINGLQVCKRLKDNNRTSPIPVILLTRFGDTETIEFGMKAGAIEYIPKDAFSDAVVVETLRQTGIIED